MSKAAMLLMLVGAFLYACWLVVWRKKPAGVGTRGRRWLFILLTLFFMSWLGAPVGVAGDAPPTYSGSTVDDESQEYMLPKAMYYAWRILGVMAKHDYLDDLGTEEERAAYRKAEEQSKRKRSRIDFGAEKENIQKSVAERNRVLFDGAVDEEVKEGRLSPGAAAFLQIAYFNLEAHFEGKKFECYYAHPPTYGPRENLFSQVALLAVAAKENTLLPDVVDAAWDSIARDLQTLRGLADSEPYPGYGHTEPEKAALDALKLAMQQAATEDEEKSLLSLYAREAASVVVDLAVHMPEKWNKSDR